MALSRESLRTTLPVVLALLMGVGACGGRLEDDRSVASGDGGAINIDGGDREGGNDQDAARNPCVSPGGYAVCGGPNACYPASSVGPGTMCTHCPLTDGTTQYTLGICSNDALPLGPPSGLCGDACVYIETLVPSQWNTLPIEVGFLFARNGAADRVRYADFSSWTGQDLPPISSCSGPSSVPTCGGSCAPCAPDQICTGRSPLHPLGLCVPKSFLLGCDRSHGWTCPSGDGCFVFSVQPEAQNEADANGSCLPVATCRAAATGLPGGGACHEKM